MGLSAYAPRLVRILLLLVLFIIWDILIIYLLFLLLRSAPSAAIRLAWNRSRRISFDRSTLCL